MRVYDTMTDKTVGELRELLLPYSKEILIAMRVYDTVNKTFIYANIKKIKTDHLNVGLIYIDGES